MIGLTRRIVFMECCRNILLYLIYEEANRQLEKAGAGASISPADILAYSLNRITPIFVSMQIDWQKQLPWLKESLRELIKERVHKAILQVRKPRLKTMSALPPNELVSPMYTLLCLRNLLQQPEMTWAELPHCLEEFLSKGGVKTPQPSNLTIKNKLSAQSAITREEYDTYTLPAQFAMMHSLESIVYRLILHRLDALPAKLAPYSHLIPIDRVMTVALGCLPPMYATTKEGMQRLRYHARMKIGSELSEIVNRAVIEVGQDMVHNPQTPSLLFQNIRQDRQEAIAKLNWMLKSKSITWKTAPQDVSAAIEQVRSTGDLSWQRLPSEV